MGLGIRLMFICLLLYTYVFHIQFIVFGDRGVGITRDCLLDRTGPVRAAFGPFLLEWEA